MSFFVTSLLWHFLDVLSESYGIVSSTSVISIFLIRTMSGLAEVTRMETESIDEGFSDARFPGTST